jgi:predicted ATPase
MSRTHLPGRTDTCTRLAHDVAQWRNGHGNVILIRGEAGMGKSETLRWLADEIGDASVRIDCRPPIGNFNVSTIQPLQPFGNAIEQLYVQSEQAAKKRLAMNIGMSLLASIPIAGDIFYAVKAISQDVSEYKRDTSATQQKKRAAVDECVDTLMRIAEQRPVALLIDDAHWSDSQSVQVLRHILPRIGDLPLLIVWAIDPASCRRVNVSLTGLLQEGPFHERTLTLSALSADGMHEMVKALVPQTAFTDREWSLLHDRTAGCPGVIREYISYLQQTSQITTDGSLAPNALDVPGLSGSAHPATDVALHAVADADATVLTLAAAEGREFTAFVVAALMNTDVLTAIRTLRGITSAPG